MEGKEWSHAASSICIFQPKEEDSSSSFNKNVKDKLRPNAKLQSIFSNLWEVGCVVQGRHVRLGLQWHSFAPPGCWQSHLLCRQSNQRRGKPREEQQHTSSSPVALPLISAEMQEDASIPFPSKTWNLSLTVMQREMAKDGMLVTHTNLSSM